MNRIRSLSLVYQLSLAVAVITALVFTGLTVFVSAWTSEGSLKHNKQSLAREVSLMSTELQFYHETLVSQTDRLSDVFFGMFTDGTLAVDPSQTVKVGRYEVPALTYQGEVINNNFTKPDAFTRMTGGSATIFERVGDDFLRVSTSLRKEDGSRAFGTMLGKQHPGYQTLMRGETYAGPAALFGRKYMTKYVPFTDATGKVIGILYIGFDYTDGLKQLKDELGSLKFGLTGYPYAIDAKPGATRGQLVMHPSLEGKNLLKLKDADGQPVFDRLLQGEQGVLTYMWKTGNGEPQQKLVAYHRVKGWNWVIAAGSYTSEYTRNSVALRNNLIMLSVVVAVVFVTLIFLVLRRQLRPLGVVGKRMEQLGAGDLNSKLDLPGLDDGGPTRNEIQLLGRQVQHMVDSLRALITGIGGSADSLTSAAAQVARVAAETNDGVKRQQTETDQVATAINELAATVQEVAKSAARAADETKAADRKAGQGSEVVNDVVTAIESLAAEVEKSAGIIGQVDKESENIGGVLEVIRGIAEQTNLLALNAAIEAARAGEQGRGFAVVADEVRNLAQKTQASTTEINDMIQRLRASTKEAVAAMEAGRSQAQDSVERAVVAGENLAEIARSTTAVTDVTVQIAAAAEEQNAVAEEINQSVIRIRDIANGTAAGADQMGDATGELTEVAKQLQASVGRFRV